MRKQLFTCIAMLLIKAAAAQNSHTDYKFAIKVYNLARYEEASKYRPVNPVGYTYYHDQTKTFKILHPTVAVQWSSKRKNVHEIELTDLNWRNTSFTTESLDSIKAPVLLYSENVREISIAARYEFIYVLGKKKERRLVPSVGFAASPYYKNEIHTFAVSSMFPRSELKAGLRMFVTPRITYFIKDRLFIDFNIPVCISDAEFTKEVNDDPSVPSLQRKVYTFDTAAFPKMFSARVGIGIKI